MLMTHNSHQQHLHVQYGHDGLPTMGNTSLKGSAITRWQARQQLKQAITLHDDRLLEALLQVHGTGCQTVRIRKNGDTPLILAVRTQYTKGVQLLLQYNGANPHITNMHGSSALDIALLASGVRDSSLDEVLILLSRISREVSVDVLTSVLDPECHVDRSRVVQIAAMLARNSNSYPVRAKLMFTLVKYYPQLIPPILSDFPGADPTGITDARMDTFRLWSDVVRMCYFRKPVLQIVSPDLFLVLIRAANGEEAVDDLLDLVMHDLELAGPVKVQVSQTESSSLKDQQRKFHMQALQMLAIAGCRYNYCAREIMSSHLPELLSWYMGNVVGKVPSLMNISRQKIRASLNCNVIYGSKQLPLPLTVQQYLCLK